MILFSQQPPLLVEVALRRKGAIFYFLFVSSMIKKHSIFASGLAAVALLGLLVPLAEPMTAEAVTGTVNVTQNISAAISITAPTAITLTPLSITQQSAVGTGAWTVTTNDYNGYTLSLNASQANALSASSTAYFSDYGTSSPTTWSVSSAYKFGFSAFGSNTTGFGSGASCNNGTDIPSNTLLYRGFYSTNLIQVASSSAPTTQAGTATTMCVADAQNTVFAPSGNYSATITATATAL